MRQFGAIGGQIASIVHFVAAEDLTLIHYQRLVGCKTKARGLLSSER
jgi:hypothetical protein